MSIAPHAREANRRLTHLENCAEVAPIGTYERGKAAAAAISDASNGILAAFREHGFRTLNDDRLRSLEAMLYAYLLESNPDDSGLITAEGFGEHIGNVPGRDLVAEAAEARDALRRATGQAAT